MPRLSGAPTTYCLQAKQFRKKASLTGEAAATLAATEATGGMDVKVA